MAVTELGRTGLTRLSASSDALLTDAAFACLVRLCEASASQPEQSVTMQHQQPN